MQEPLSFAAPDIGQEEIDEVVDTLRSGWLTSGPKAARFEQAYRDYVGAGYAVAVNSCTAGLHLALAALGVGPGDEVITTPLTFCATVNVIVQIGATPVLADIGPDLNLSPEAIWCALTPRTRAIVPVHFAGLPCDMDPIWEIAARRQLRIIEDAAHAAGAMYRGRHIGAGPSDAVAFSFYATKNLTTGEGGMITTSSSTLAERMRLLALHGITADGWKRYADVGNWYYEVQDCGFKYNLSDVLASIGIRQLKRLEDMTARRTAIASAYNAAFSRLEELELPPVREDSRHCWHLYVLRLNLDSLAIGRDLFIEEMRLRGIGCSVHFIPIPLHPYYSRIRPIRSVCPRALSEYPRLVSLPLYSRMTDADVERVIAAVKDVVTRFRKPYYTAAAA